MLAVYLPRGKGFFCQLTYLPTRKKKNSNSFSRSQVNETARPTRSSGSRSCCAAGPRRGRTSPPEACNHVHQGCAESQRFVFIEESAISSRALGFFVVQFGVRFGDRIFFLRFNCVLFSICACHVLIATTTTTTTTIIPSSSSKRSSLKDDPEQS